MCGYQTAASNVYMLHLGLLMWVVCVQALDSAAAAVEKAAAAAAAAEPAGSPPVRADSGVDEVGGGSTMPEQGSSHNLVSGELATPPAAYAPTRPLAAFICTGCCSFHC